MCMCHMGSKAFEVNNLAVIILAYYNFRITNSEAANEAEFDKQANLPT